MPVRFPDSVPNPTPKMISETNSNESQPQRIAFAPLKPKRRFKPNEEIAEATESYAPVLIDARTELNRRRARITRTGRINAQWRRITPPSELLRVMPNNSRPPLLARVVDKVKNPQPRIGHHQGIWSLLRCWALALR